MLTFLIVAIAILLPLLRVRGGIESVGWCSLSVLCGSVVWWASCLLGEAGADGVGWLFAAPVLVALIVMGRHYRRIWQQARTSAQDASSDQPTEM